MSVQAGRHEMQLNQVSMRWDLDAGLFNLLGHNTVMLWTDPSLRYMLGPLAEELGADRFRLLVAHGSAQGTKEDYEIITRTQGSTFEEGFEAWVDAIATAGWGRTFLKSFDSSEKRALVRIDRPFELELQEASLSSRSSLSWGCPFLLGKVIGIFSQVFGCNCWADEVFQENDGVHSVEFRVYPSSKTIESELEDLRRKAEEEIQRPLLEAQRDLAERLALIERQQQTIQALATPILQVWEGVLALPIVGIVDNKRAASITEGLLDAVVKTRARYAILDMTGVDVIDTSTASHFQKIIQAISLLGAECFVTGIRPAVAQTMVELGAGYERARTYSTMQSALQGIFSIPSPEGE